MERVIKRILPFFFIIFIAILVLVFLIYIRKQHAINLAKEYLLKKYSQKMDYLDSCFSIIDPSLFRIYFSPENNKRIVFTVLVQQDLSILDKRRDDGYYSPDDYLLEKFKLDFTDIFFSIAKSIWSDGIPVVISINEQPLYSYKVPIELNEKMSTKEMEKYINYNIYISPDYFFDKKTNNEPDMIFELIKEIRKETYSPNEIIFCYKDAENNDRYFSFDRWFEIETVDDVKCQLNFVTGLKLGAEPDFCASYGAVLPNL
jgi:hypothetical protein